MRRIIDAPLRLSRALMLVLPLVGITPRVALAHTRLKRSTPAEGAKVSAVPRELRLEFSESPELGVSSMRLTGPGGREITLGPLGYATDTRRAIVATVVSPMSPGTYTVAWQVAGDDGHPVRGHFSFVFVAAAASEAPAPRAPDVAADSSTATVTPTPTPSEFGVESPAYVLVRWLEFVGLLLVIGAWSFRSFVLVPLHGAANAIDAGTSAMAPDADRRAARLGTIAAVALAVALVLRLVAQSYAMRDATHALDVGLVSSLVERTKWGTGWLAQLVGIVVAGVGYRRRWWTLAGVGAALTALSPALSGHAAAAERFGLLAILADWVHVLGAGSWLGTLAVLLFAGMSSPDSTRLGRGEWVRVLVQRFSPIALVSAAAATITGIFAAWIHVGTIPNLWGTRYGVTLLVKLGLLVAVMLAGAYNWRVVQRRLGPDDAAAQLRRSATVEVVLAVLVLLVTAVLVATPTPLGVGP